MSMSQRMKRFDPYSTPARRRRIIADVAKTVLRQWYIQGCENVHRFRIETSASIKLQCFVRAAMARNKLAYLRQRRRNQAAVKIQTVYRRYRAICRKIQLLKDRLLMRQKRLVNVVEHLWAIRKAKLFRAALVISRRLAQEKRRNNAARDIQRIFRGHSSRRIYKFLRYHRRQEYYRRYFAASVIQKYFRRWRCQLRFKNLRKWHRASHRITSLFIRHHFWKKQQRKRLTRNRAAIRIQCWYRCVRARKLKNRLLLAKLMRIPRFEITHHPLEIQLELSPKALGVFASRPVNVFMHWCLQQCLLQYSVDTGYRAGSVVHQVIASVSKVQENQSHSQAISSPQKEVDVKVDAWDYSSGHLPSNHPKNHHHDLPPMPEDWDIPLIATSSNSKPSTAQQNTKDGGIGDEICCRKTSSSLSHHPHPMNMLDYLLQLNIRSLPVTMRRDDTSKPPVVYQTVYETIIRFVPTSWTMSASVQAFVSDEHIVPSHLNETNNDELDALFLEDAVFRFQNAMVYVPAKPPPAPIPTVTPFILEFHDSDSEDDLQLSKQVTPVKELPTIVEDNTITTIRIHLSTPSPPPVPMRPVILSPPKPPPINYGHMARRIQRKYLKRLRHRITAAKAIQAMQRRYWCLEKWRNLVYDYWEQCFDAAVVLQCAFRLYFAQRTLKRLRFERDEWYFPFGHDFEHSTERENWRAFGMVLPDLTIPEGGDGKRTEPLSALEEFCSPSYFLHLSPDFAGKMDKATKDGLFVPSVNGTSEMNSMPDMNLTHPPIWQVLQKLAVPDMPPNCIFPQSWMDTFVVRDELREKDVKENKPHESQENTEDGSSSNQRKAVRFQETTEISDSSGEGDIDQNDTSKVRSRSVLADDPSVYESMLLTHFLSGPSPLACFESLEMEKQSPLASSQPTPHHHNNQKNKKSSKNGEVAVVPTSGASTGGQRDYSRRWKKQQVRIRRWQRACWGTPVDVIKPPAGMVSPRDGSEESVHSKVEKPLDSLGLGEVSVIETETGGDESDEDVKKGPNELDINQWEQDLVNVNDDEDTGVVDDESLFVFNGWLDGSVFDDQGREFPLLPPLTPALEGEAQTKVKPPSIVPLFPASFYASVHSSGVDTREAEEQEVTTTAAHQKPSMSISRPLTGKVRPDQRAFFPQQPQPQPQLQPQPLSKSRSSKENRWTRLRWMSAAAAPASSNNRTHEKPPLPQQQKTEDDEAVDSSSAVSNERLRRLHAVQSLQAAHLWTPLYTHLAQHGV